MTPWVLEYIIRLRICFLNIKGAEPMFPASLEETAAALRTGEFDLLDYINQRCDLIDATEPQIHALLPESDRRARLLTEAQALQARFPDPGKRPP